MGLFSTVSLSCVCVCFIFVYNFFFFLIQVLIVSPLSHDFAEVPEEKGAAPEFIKVPKEVVAREHDTAKFLVKVIGSPKPTGITQTLID
jgi:hypothetical protein